MQHAVGVSNHQRVGHLQGDLQRPGGRQEPDPLELGCEGGAFDVLQNQVRLTGLGVAGIEALNDVGVAQDGRCARLVEESLGELLIRRQLRFEELDGHPAAGDPVAGFVDHRHSAVPEGSDDVISVDLRKIARRRGSHGGMIGHLPHQGSPSRTSLAISRSASGPGGRLGISRGLAARASEEGREQSPPLPRGHWRSRRRTQTTPYPTETATPR